MTFGIYLIASSALLGLIGNNSSFLNLYRVYWK